MWEYKGKIVGDRYKLDSIIGRGGFGFVCLAEHVRLNRPLAIKFLHSEFTRDKKLVQRFENEARRTCSIGHPNIIDIIDYGEDTELGYYFVMEYLIQVKHFRKN